MGTALFLRGSSRAAGRLFSIYDVASFHFQLHFLLLYYSLSATPRLRPTRRRFDARLPFLMMKFSPGGVSFISCLCYSESASLAVAPIVWFWSTVLSSGKSQKNQNLRARLISGHRPFYFILLRDADRSPFQYSHWWTEAFHEIGSTENSRPRGLAVTVALSPVSGFADRTDHFSAGEC